MLWYTLWMSSLFLERVHKPKDLLRVGHGDMATGVERLHRELGTA